MALTSRWQVVMGGRAALRHPSSSSLDGHERYAQRFAGERNRCFGAPPPDRPRRSTWASAKDVGTHNRDLPTLGGVLALRLERGGLPAVLLAQQLRLFGEVRRCRELPSPIVSDFLFFLFFGKQLDYRLSV